MDSDQRKGLLPYDQTSGVPSASYLLPNLVLAVSCYHSRLANSGVQAIVVVAAVDRYHMVLQVKANMLVVLVSEKASKEENAAGIPVPVVGVAADNHVTGFLSEEPHCFERAYIHWDVADSKSHCS